MTLSDYQRGLRDHQRVEESFFNIKVSTFLKFSGAVIVMLTCQTRPGPTPGDKGKGEGRASTSILIYICFQQSQVVVFSAWVDMLIHYYYAIYIGADGLSFYADDH